MAGRVASRREQNAPGQRTESSSGARQTGQTEVSKTVGQRGSPGSLPLRARTVARAKSPHHARQGRRGAVHSSERRGQMSGEVFVGIDVAKDTVEVAVRPSGERWEERNDGKGWKKLVRRLREVSPKLVVMEATGGYEAEVALRLTEASIPIRILNPRQVRDFARGKGLLAKTDGLDAAVLAEYAETYRPEPRALPGEEAREMAALLSRRRQLVEMRVAEQNRLEQARGEVRKRIVAHIAWLESEIERTESDLDQRIRKSPLFLDKHERLTTVPGVGNQTALSLILNLPELGMLDRKEIASLAGVAPFNKDSGAYRGKRTVWGGRAKVRAALYMAAVVAARHNEVIRTFYEKLVAAGKPKKVALTACMRKLLTILNAITRNQSVWTPALAISR
jgi:transposase